MSVLGWSLKSWGIALAVSLGTIAVVNRTPLKGYVLPNP